MNVRTLSAFHKVQWLHCTGEVDTFIIFLCDVSSGFCVPKITKIGSFFTELFFLNQGVVALLTHGVGLYLFFCQSMCPHAYLENHVVEQLNFTDFYTCCLCSWLGPPLAPGGMHSDMLCTSGFVGDVMFSHNGHTARHVYY